MDFSRETEIDSGWAAGWFCGRFEREMGKREEEKY